MEFVHTSEIFSVSDRRRAAKIDVCLENETVWLTQKQFAEFLPLFLLQHTVLQIFYHLIGNKKIFHCHTDNGVSLKSIRTNYR